MSNEVFLYRLKDDDDRDACAYIEQPGRWECGHYFGGVNLCGPCYCGRSEGWPDYDEIETILTKDEYRKLVAYDAAIHLLGFGITEGDERYITGMTLTKLIQPVWDKLNSDEAYAFFSKIMESEDEILMDEYDLDTDDLDAIFSAYALNYHDRSVVNGVFRDVDDLAYEEADSLGLIDRSNPYSERYFDFETFGDDLLDEEQYVLLADGRVACLSY